MKKVLVLGSGGREHALVKKLSEDCKVYCYPGNAGIAMDAIVPSISFQGEEDFPHLLDFVQTEGIDLTVVGPEMYLEMGVVDYLEMHGQKVFGCLKSAALLETSKVYSKQFMIKHGIPTASYHTLCVGELPAHIDDMKFPIVLKADGLAAGKGVIICQNKEDVLRASETLRAFSNELVVEEFLTGHEASIMCFVDGKTIKRMPPARDHKRLLDADLGPNTGGMGAISPDTSVPEAVLRVFDEQVATPFMKGLQKDGLDFRGVLFVGIMYEGDEVKVLEFNTRFGDPETEVTLPRLQNSLYDILMATACGCLSDQELRFDETYVSVVVLAAKEYPTAKTSPVEIQIQGNPQLIHFGTSRSQDGRLMATGGRVLGVMGQGKSVEESLDKAYAQISCVDFVGMQYRRDIGKTF